MKIQLIRNATLKINYGNQMILLDPWLQDKGKGFSAMTVKSEMAGIHNPMDELPFTPEEILDSVDFCLITHIHPDHFTEDYLPKDIPLIVPDADDLQKATAMGFRYVQCIEEDTLQIGNIFITKVPAVHGENPAVVEKMGKSCGYVLQGEEKTLYIAGDTVFYNEVKKTLEQYHPEVVTVNCCEATIPLGRLIMNMDDVETVCSNVPFARVIATHLDSVNHALLTSDDVKRISMQKGLTQIMVPEKGEWIEIASVE